MTRQLKPIGVRDGLLGHGPVADLTEAPEHIRQFDIVTFAPTKAAAAENLTALAITFTVSRIRVQMGNAVDAIAASTLPLDDGSVYVWHHSANGAPIVRVKAGEQPRVVARWQRTPAGDLLVAVEPTP